MKRAFSWPRALGLLAIMLLATWAVAQTTISTGSISGTVTDQTGAVVAGAAVTITNTATNQASTTTTSSTGLYQSGALIPGVYSVKVAKPGFATQQITLTVAVGVTANGGMSLKPGTASQVINVEASTLEVNTQQATVQGVLTAQQIESLPVNGRNFLDLAQLEPGVQIQEGSTFDPTKNGFSSISFEGRFGRTARIEVDGLDVSDETVGTTTQNIPASAIQEFQLSQSSLDPSTELTSSGAVNVVTRSGGNTMHGEGFYLIRDSRTAATLPGPAGSKFQRQQFGGRLGGAIIKDKLFWFLDAERTKQDLGAPQPWSGTFLPLSGLLGEPFRETMGIGRLDWNISGNARLFYRFTYDQLKQVRPYGSASSFQPFANRNATPAQGVGLDFTTGKWTHSIRFGYLKFRNQIADATSGLTGAINPVPGVGINLGSNIFFGNQFASGPNLLAPQATYQSDHQIKYDGSRMFGNHILRYGFAYNRIHGGGFASFFGAGPAMGNDIGTALTGGVVTTNFTDPNPADYLTRYLFLGNGAGCASEKPAFGLNCGGYGPDNRIEWYIADSWRLTPRFTLNYALHYVRDDGRDDADAPVTSGLNAFLPGFGNPPRIPSKNFGPQVGFAWDVTGSGKTVIRAGAGLFYENSIWNNVLFDRPIRLANGSFLYTPPACYGAQAIPIEWPGGAGAVPSSPWLTNNGDGTATATGICNQPVGNVASGILFIEQALQTAQKAVGTTGANAIYFNSINAVVGGNNTTLIPPDYVTPRSVQMNIGVQHEIRPGTVLTVDYLRNIGTHFNLVVDRNHMGAARYFNSANAVADRDAAQASVGCAAGPGQAACVIAAAGGAANAEALYSSYGFDSGNTVAGGYPCPTCAFPGENQNYGQVMVNEPWGRSVYNGLQISLKHDTSHFFGLPGVKHANFQISYALGKFISQVQDQDFTSTASDFDNPLKYTGWNSLDRKHQISFGAVFNLPWYTQVSFIGHFYSPLSATLTMPQTTSGGEIFASDLTGDGTVGDVIPGTNVGSYGRQFGVSGMQAVINNFNSTYAGQLTPAGQAVVGSGVMSLADMQALGWVIPTLPGVDAGALNFPWLRTFDLKMAWPIKVTERITIEPSIGFYNIFNVANGFLPGNLPSGALYGDGTTGCGGNGCIASGTIGGVTSTGANAWTPYRATMQSGTYGLGAPRQIEFGLRLTF
jgi:hypothetical protein